MNQMDKPNEFSEYTKTYRRRHPEKVLQWRVAAAINLLRSQGYTVTLEPTESVKK